MGPQMSPLFQNALFRKPNLVPPVWMMRQAGRYHSHYQNLRKSYSFTQLCKDPKLAAETALGPIQDFDFDVAILFSDILFPLMALRFPIVFEEFGGPKLLAPLKKSHLLAAPSTGDALHELYFQKEAMIETRRVLPANKSLIGFIGGPWTLFTFATQGSHKNGIRDAKMAAHELWPHFEEVILPLLAENIRLQIEGGAEVVMVLDTAAGDLAHESLGAKVIRPLQQLTRQFPVRIGYYSKGMDLGAFHSVLRQVPDLAGIGVDQRTEIMTALKTTDGFVQGNFDPDFMSLPESDFRMNLRRWWNSHQIATTQDFSGWVCGLGHGLTPNAKQDNVRLFVQLIREWSSEVKR